MRIAVISDIHGNAASLECVLSALQTEQTDHMVCLGDVASDGPQPREVLAHLRSLDASVVRGNMDAWILDPQPIGGRSKNAERGNEIRFWGARQLSPDDLSYLSGLPVSIQLALDSSTDLLCYHGSPRSHEEAISSTTPDADLEHMLSGCDAKVFAGGHTHTQIVRCQGDATILNPGSAGAPPSRGGQDQTPCAEYAILCWEAGGARIELRRVPVDVGLVMEAASDCGMPHPDWWVQTRYGTVSPAPSAD